MPERVALCGWVHGRREHGEHLAFVDLRDHSGLVQCVVDGSVDVRSEWVVRVEGTVQGVGFRPYVYGLARQVMIKRRAYPGATIDITNSEASATSLTTIVAKAEGTRTDLPPPSSRSFWPPIGHGSSLSRHVTVTGVAVLLLQLTPGRYASKR